MDNISESFFLRSEKTHLFSQFSELVPHMLLKMAEQKVEILNLSIENWKNTAVKLAIVHRRLVKEEREDNREGLLVEKVLNWVLEEVERLEDQKLKIFDHFCQI